MGLMIGFGPVAKALVVFDYSASANERFQGGTFASNPAANSSFFLSSYDFSGVGWQTGSTSFAVTMVSPQHFLAAAHAAPGTGASVSFLGSDGTVRNYTVGSTTPIYFSDGVASDLVVGTLTSAVASQVTYYPSIYLGSNLSNYVGINLAVYGAGGRVGMNSIAGFGTADFNPHDGVTDNLFAVMNYDATTGGTQAAPAAAQGEGGDSSSPSFALVGGNLAVVGIHSAINGNPPPQQTYDTFVPGYIGAIDSVLQTGGYNFSYYAAIPEPASVAAWLALSAGVVVGLRRRRSK